MKTNLTLLVVLAVCGWFAYQNMSQKQTTQANVARTEAAAVLVQAANVVSPSTNTVVAIVPKPEPVAPADVVAPAPVPPKDWEVAGRTYHNVTVTRVEPDCVHVTYDGGAGSIPLAEMLPDLRRCFKYDPAAAQAAADAKEAARNAAIAALPPPPPVVAVPVAPPATAPASSTVDRAAIQAQIDYLTQDIAQKQSEVDRNMGKENSHSITSQNPYREIISREQQEVAELSQQLR